MGDRAPGDDGPDGTVTLAFSLDAIGAYADPPAVFADARRWSRHVGIVDDDPDAVAAFVARHGLRQDYELGSLEPYAVLSRLKWEADTDRYVLVGAGEADEALTEYVDWEYVPMEEAAAAADWTLAEETGVLHRVRRFLSRVPGRR
jgi:hypothetical protein